MTRLFVLALLGVCLAFVSADEPDCTSRADGGRPCTGAWLYGFNGKANQCQRFYFYGSEGNDNQFETQDECEEACDGDDADDVCELEIARGKTCYSNNWYFAYGSCRMFGYQGTGGNGNNYKTKEECEEACLEEDKPDCESRADGGKPCVGAYVYGYDSKSNQCRRFYFYGSEGNENQFENQDDCEEACKGDDADEVCELEIARGKTCYSNRWYFGYGSCRQFGYQGTGGNGNNYVTKEECEEACLDEDSNETKPGPRPTVPARTTTERPASAGPDCESRPDGGRPCAGAYLYGFDTRSSQCRRFYFYGSEGNDNQFETQAECEDACDNEDEESDEVCELGIAAGKTCYSNRWYYVNDSCRQFGYQGTGGNGNNYETKEECEDACTEQ